MEEYLNELISIIVSKQEKLIIIPGKIKTLRTIDCDVSRAGQPDLLNVRLHSILESPTDYVKVEPKVGSDVLVAIIENHPTEGFLLSTSEISKTSVKIGTTAIEVSKDGIKAERNGQNLKSVITDFMDSVKTGMCATAVGPAPLDPPTQAKIQLAISKVSQILI